MGFVVLWAWGLGFDVFRSGVLGSCKRLLIQNKYLRLSARFGLSGSGVLKVLRLRVGKV